MKRILFIDRDGVLLKEPVEDLQVDSIEKTRFVPGAITALSNIAAEFDFYKVMVTNQDGMGTAAYPAEKFHPYQQLLLRTLEGEGFKFDEILIDTSFEHESKPTRKPGIGLLAHLLSNEEYDIKNSLAIGDRWSDMQLAKNIGCKAIHLKALHKLSEEQEDVYRDTIILATDSWPAIYSFLKLGLRKVQHQRITNETTISIELNLDGNGNAVIDTGLGFFDHMLEQIARHGKCDLKLITKGDLHIDEHHTIEDTGIALGEAFAKALADKKGMERYGFALPMDEAAATVLLDFGGRNDIIATAD